MSNDYTKLISWEPSASISRQPTSTDLARALGVSPLVASLLAARGMTTPDAARAFLDPQHYRPTPPEALPDLGAATALLHEAVRRRQPILVWGDFDVDGQTATALLVTALRGLGATVDYYIPSRLEESHGVHLPALTQQISQQSPALLLTCDTGISAHGAIDYAKKGGLSVIITDHHDLPDSLPVADAVLNPKRLPPAHPFAALPGVGVAYKLVEALFDATQRPGKGTALTDLVALGIVADVAALRDDTRYLLQVGLAQLRQAKRAGLAALCEIAQLDPGYLTETDIAFQIAPRLNAAGRLDDARLGVDLLTATDPEQAQMLALTLEGLNNQRRLFERQILAAAQAQIEQDPALLEWRALVLASTTWHAGLLGIVANRLAEQYARPVVLLTITGDTARGSARSFAGYDISAAIAAQADLLHTFGGHPGAAGLSLPADHIPAFRRRLSDALAAQPTPLADKRLPIDAVIPLRDVTLDLAHDIERLAPFGEGNPRPILVSERLMLDSATYLGREEAHRQLTVRDEEGTRQKVLWWNSASATLPSGLFDLAFQVQVSTYRGEPELQLTLVDYQPSPSAPVIVQTPTRLVVDRRQFPHPAQVLADIQREHPQAIIWAEGYRRAESPGLPLSLLQPGETLIIFTTPNSPQALSDALRAVAPGRIVLIGADPPLVTRDAVLRRLIELLKFVITHEGGTTTVHVLAEAVAQPPETVRLALRYLHSCGLLTWREDSAGNLALTAAADSPTAGDRALLSAFQAHVDETAAYRAYFRRAAPEQLLAEEFHDEVPNPGPDNAR
ncbi:MAG: single-stranded-DNA-specific exonuclease RecJ [Chloroflexota bacterium]